jgi:hypothetical protein
MIIIIVVVVIIIIIIIISRTYVMPCPRARVQACQ